MKKLALILALALGASASMANISVTWLANADAPWFYNNDGTDYPGVGAGGAFGTWLVELVDAGTSPLNVANAVTAFENGLALPAGSSLVTPAVGVNQTSFDGDGAGFSQTTALDNTTYASHYLYMVFFNAPTFGQATEAGFVYGVGTAWQLGAADSSITLDAFDPGAITAGSIQGGAVGNYSAGDPYPGYYTLPVPEPTSMALFGLGGLLIGIRRKFRKA